MPMYEYFCEKCEKTTEALRPMAQADEPIACEHCNSSKTKRAHSVFSAGASSTSGPADFCPPMGSCGACGDPRGSCSMN